MAGWIINISKILNLSGQLVLLFDYCHSEEVFFCVQIEFHTFQFLQIVSWPVSVHH